MLGDKLTWGYLNSPKNINTDIEKSHEETKAYYSNKPYEEGFKIWDSGTNLERCNQLVAFQVLVDQTGPLL